MDNGAADDYAEISADYHTVGEPGFACTLISTDPTAQQGCYSGFSKPTDEDDKGGEEWVNI